MADKKKTKSKSNDSTQKALAKKETVKKTTPKVKAKKDTAKTTNPKVKVNKETVKNLAHLFLNYFSQELLCSQH